MKLDLTDLPAGTYTLTRTADGYSLERLEPYPYAGGGGKSGPIMERRAITPPSDLPYVRCPRFGHHPAPEGIRYFPARIVDGYPHADINGDGWIEVLEDHPHG